MVASLDAVLTRHFQHVFKECHEKTVKALPDAPVSNLFGVIGKSVETSTFEEHEAFLKDALSMNAALNPACWKKSLLNLDSLNNCELSGKRTFAARRAWAVREAGSSHNLWVATQRCVRAKAEPRTDVKKRLKAHFLAAGGGSADESVGAQVSGGGERELVPPDLQDIYKLSSKFLAALQLCLFPEVPF